MIFLFTIIVAAWLVVIFFKVAYYVYAWQTKEYRLLRLWSGLQEPGGLSLIFGKLFWGSLLLGALALVFSESIFYLVFIYYVLACLIALVKFAGGRQKFPAPSLKVMLLFLLSFALPVVALTFVSFSSVDGALIYMVAIDILIFFIVSLFVLLFKPPTYWLKQRLVAKAQIKRHQAKHLISIGIAGSVGKTSTKEFLSHILDGRFRVVKTKEHQNTEVGCARAILSLKKNTQVLIAEMGAYQKGDIKEISSLVKPSVGIITSVGQEHVSLFGDVRTAIETEFELAQVLPDDGLLVVNWDNADIQATMKTLDSKIRLMRYSIKDKKADVYATDIKEGLESIAFTVHNKKAHTKKRFQANLLGKHNVSNILGATAAALHLGMKLSQIAKAVSTLKQLAHTMNVHHGIGNLIVVDDTYNASPQAVTSAFAHVKYYKKQKKILIMPSLIELGEDAQYIHEQIATAAGAIFDVAIMSDRKYYEAIKRGWQKGGGDTSALLFSGNEKNIIRLLEYYIDNNSLLLLEGRLPKNIISMLLHHFYLLNE